MKQTILRHLCRCIFFALATTALADNAPLWLTTTNTVTAPAGTPVLLKALAEAVPAPQYFWLSNSVPIPGATNNSYSNTVNTVTTNVNWSIVASNYLGMNTNGPFRMKFPTGIQTNFTWGNVTLAQPSTNSVLDLLRIGKHINGTAPLTGVALGLADANQDGVVNGADQALIQNNILGRVPLATVSQMWLSIDPTNGLLYSTTWQNGLFQNSADSDGDGVPDITELANGTDPLDPRSLIPFGTYLAAPPVTIFNLTPNTNDYGVFVATPPVTITISH